MSFTDYGNYNNICYNNSTTSLAYDRSGFKPTMWCDKQWKNLSSDCKGLGELAKRILIFVPLVFASLVAYPISLVCCISLATTYTNSSQMAAITGPGVLATRTQDLKPYHINEVELQCIGNLVINKGNANSLSTSTDDNIINSFESRVEGSKLIISMKPGFFRFLHSPSYTLTIPTDLRYLSVSGSGCVTMDELVADTFSCNISGSGNVNILKGSVNHQSIKISGSGRYVAPNLLGVNSHTNISGSGRAVIQATDTLKVNISGSGKCEYFGNPQITKNISGSGSIQHKH